MRKSSPSTGSRSKASCPSLWPTGSLLFQPASPPSPPQLPRRKGGAEMMMPADNFRNFPPPCHQQNSVKQKKETGRLGEEMASGKVSRLQVIVKNCWQLTEYPGLPKWQGTLGWQQKKIHGYRIFSTLLFLDFLVSAHICHKSFLVISSPRTSDSSAFLLKLCLNHHFTKCYCSP